MKTNIGIYLSAIVVLFFFVHCTRSDKPQIVLSGKNWDAFNKQQIENLINKYGKTSENYDPAIPPYAVFDWDNTSIFLDIEEATLIYQLDNLNFGCDPAQLDTAIRVGIKDRVLKNATNKAGEKITFNQVAADIISSYSWLYTHYKPLGGKGELSLKKIKESPHFTNFTAKVRFLYAAINDTYSSDVAYPWITYLFAGLDSNQVRKMTYETVKSQSDSSISTITWESPDPSLLSGQLSGQVSVKWKNGLRLIPEMQDLYNKFRESGIDVWICSASFVDVIKEISSNPEFAYNNNANHVLAMELERDSNGKILPAFRKGYFQTQRMGKYKAIEKFLADSTGKYGYPPLFIAGDSEGDQDMLNVKNLPIKLGLIINRKKGKNELLGKLSLRAIQSYKTDTALYLLQGRDEKSGCFVANQGDTNMKDW